MKSYEITAEVRTSKGKGPARRLRRDGKIPAVLYGSGSEVTPLQVKPDRVEMLRRQPLGWNTPVSLDVDGLSGKKLVMVKETQRHPVSRRLMHVDFWRIDEDQPIVVPVPINPIGESTALSLGGQLHILRHAVELRCKCADIPEVIDVDISELEVGEKLFVDEVPLPPNVEAVYEQRFPLLSIALKGIDTEEEEIDEEEEGEEAADEEDESAEE